MYDSLEEIDEEVKNVEIGQIQFLVLEILMLE